MEDKERIAQAADILRRGGLLAIPTETVYGLAGNRLDPKAVAQIYEVKGRFKDGTARRITPLFCTFPTQAGSRAIARMCRRQPTGSPSASGPAR